MELISLVIFIFCAAMAAEASAAHRLLEEHPAAFVRSLFYHNIFISAFGFYGIWGQFIIVFFAGSRIAPDTFSTVSVISLLLGLPFLVFGWMMLLKFGAEAAGFQFRNYFTLFFLLVNFGIIITLSFVIREMDFSEALPLFKYYYSAAAVFFSVAAALILIRGKSDSPGKRDRSYLAALIAAGALSQAAVLLLLPYSVLMALVFAFLLFASITLLPLYLTYGADLRPCFPPDPRQLPQGIGEFIRRHEISPREADIISEICNGLSNQEIADKLFISLQTVKDHTSRIYSKTNVRNRMQLMAMVQGLATPGTK
ncbi:MAG: LuxR C-terminal-related transcriptional regulator [Bacteroidales bacterium]|nr:LuxR C-terminal-related transcriptional regulator [Bacteroidales bacterium]